MFKKTTTGKQLLPDLAIGNGKTAGIDAKS